MAFRGWPVEAIEFDEGLEADNSKAYWTAHRDTYERSVKGPMDELLAELAPEFGEGRVFRPHRDVRFSTDTSPYKTAIAASLGEGGYVQLSSSGLGAGCGAYQMTTEQLAAFRRAVDDGASGGQLQALVADARSAGLEARATARSRRRRAALRGTTLGSTCCGRRACTPGGSGSPGRGWGRHAPRSEWSSCCGPRPPCGAGSTPTSSPAPAPALRPAAARSWPPPGSPPAPAPR